MNNSDRIPTHNRRLPLIVTGCVFILAGFAGLIWFGLMLHITCTRSDALTTCQTRVTFMGIIPLGDESTLQDVRRAELVESCTDNGERDICSYNVDITSAAGIRRLNGHFFSEPTALEIVGDINLLKEAPANGEVLRKNLQNRPLLGLGWICVVGPLLILGILFSLSTLQNGPAR